MYQIDDIGSEKRTHIEQFRRLISEKFSNKKRMLITSLAIIEEGCRYSFHPYVFKYENVNN